MTETRLYFGLSRPDGKIVSGKAFASFVASDITPALPEGFTILDGRGYWKDGTSSRTIAEPSKVLVRLHQATRGSNTALDRIADAYKRSFHQESVLRTDTLTCADFR